MKENRARKARAKPVTARQKIELAALAALPDDKIDTHEMPEVRDWPNAKRGLFHRSNRQN